MDHKSWIWKKRSTEKTLVADKTNSSLSRKDELSEVQELLTEKADMERDLQILNDKLTSAISECNEKDNMAKAQAKLTQEAIAGWEKAETEAISLKRELGHELLQKVASEERLENLDIALKQCIKQLHFSRAEQEKRVHGAVVKASEEFEKTQTALDEKLAEAIKRLAKLDAENAQISKILSSKDKTIGDLNKYITKVEADFNALLLRVESTEKENASLKYEVRVLQKEHDIRNEEREFNRRTAEVAEKQHQESVKKIVKLESECQKLRLLVRKRLPGPAALAKMKNEVEMLGKDQFEARRRKSSPSLISSMDFHADMSTDSPIKRINFLTEQLHMMEKENRVLKNAINKKSSEHQSSRAMYVRTPSRLSRVGQVKESFECQTTAEPGNPYFPPDDSLAASSDLGSDDKVSCAESWASASATEFEHSRNDNLIRTPSHRSMGTSVTNFMADFAEMEKLVVFAENSAERSHHLLEEGDAIIVPSGIPYGRHSSVGTGREVIPSNRAPSDMIDVTKVILEHCQVSKGNPLEILDDMNATTSTYIDSSKANESTNHTYASYSPKVSPHSHNSRISSSRTLSSSASDKISGNNVLLKAEREQIIQSDVSAAVHKILQLLEGIHITFKDDSVAESLSGKTDKFLLNNNIENPTGYMVRVFQWKTVELSAIFQQFSQTCNNLLNGTSDLQHFSQQVASSLEWVMNHCFSLQDVSSMKDAIRNHLDWDELRSESEVDCGSTNHSAESNTLHNQRDEMPLFHMINCSFRTEDLQPKIKEVHKRSNIGLVNMESSRVSSEGRQQLEMVEGESSRIKLQESKAILENLLSRMGAEHLSNEKTEHQIEKQKMMKPDLEIQMMEPNLAGSKACQNIPLLDNVLDDKDNYCQTSEESMKSKEVQDYSKHWDSQLRNELETSAASEKLVECQETILNLRKQLTALASHSDAALFNKIMSSLPGTIDANVPIPGRSISQRSSLLDQMLAEDNGQIDASPSMKEDAENEDSSPPISTNAAIGSQEKLAVAIGINHEANKDTVAAMAIVPIKKKGDRSFLKKLFWLTKKGNNVKKTPYS